MCAFERSEKGMEFFMNNKRVFEIINNKEIKDIYYDDRPVWVQEINNNMAKIGFMDNIGEKDVYIKDLYETL